MIKLVLSLLLLSYSVESLTINPRVSAKRIAATVTTVEPSTLRRLNVETRLHRFGTNDVELEEMTRSDSNNSGGMKHNRREMLSCIINGSLVASLSSCFLPWMAAATEFSNIGIGTPERPIVIIGGGGRTGMAVAEAVAGEIGQMNGVIMTRYR